MSHPLLQLVSPLLYKTALRNLFHPGSRARTRMFVCVCVCVYMYMCNIFPLFSVEAGTAVCLDFVV
jgi:hypothetical protein